MGIVARLVIVCFVAWCGYHLTVVVKHLHRLGFWTHTFNHAPGPCSVFHVNGSEDIDVLPNGIAIFTSGSKYSLDGHPDPNMLIRDGKLYAFDLNNPSEAPKELTLENFEKSDFNPLGLDVYIDSATNKPLVFVVNRGSNVGIEIFQFDQQRLVLKHKKTVRDKNIYLPNDVVAVGPESFYVTNDFYSVNIILRQIEAFYPFHLGSIAFYDGQTAKIVASNMEFANGIDIDKSGRYVFAISGSDNSIFVFKRNQDNSLDKRQEIFVGSLLDNINVDDETGNLLTAGLTQAPAYMEYNKNLTKPCPSKVFIVKLSDKNSDDVPFKIDNIVEVYSGTGEDDFKCASTAVTYKGNLLIGSIFDNLMYCEVLAM